MRQRSNQWAPRVAPLALILLAVFANILHNAFALDDFCRVVDDPGIQKLHPLWRGGRAWLATVALPPLVREQVDGLLGLVDHLDVQIAGLDREVRQLAAATPQAQQLQTIPGIGAFGALLLLAEIGTITCFGSSHELAA